MHTVTSADTPASIPITHLVFGNFGVAQKIMKFAEKDFPASLPFMRCYSEAMENRDEFYFIRDRGVLRPDGKLLLPHVITYKYLDENYQALSFNYRYDLGNKGFCGYGFTQEMQEKILQDSVENNYPILRGKTCIEGGNVFLFKGLDGRPRAIIGENSEVLSFIALMETGYFEKNGEILNQRKEALGTPSDEYVRMARNYFILMGSGIRFKNGENHSDLDNPTDGFATSLIGLDQQTDYAPRLQSPVSESDRQLYGAQALELQARFGMTRARIAKELQVLPEHLAVYKGQDKFHIDFLASVNERAGIVYMQGRQESIDALSDAIAAQPLLNNTGQLEEKDIQQLYLKYKAIKKRTPELLAIEARFLKYLEYYRYIHEVENPFEKENIEAIEKATGFKVALLPGMFDVLKEQHEEPDDYEHSGLMNSFFNGFYLHNEQGTTFVTNGGDPYLKEAFAKAMQKVTPSLQIRFLQSMADKVANDKGGVLCLTLKTGFHSPSN